MTADTPLRESIAIYRCDLGCKTCAIRTVAGELASGGSRTEASLL